MQEKFMIVWIFRDGFDSLLKSDQFDSREQAIAWAKKVDVSNAKEDCEFDIDTDRVYIVGNGTVDELDAPDFAVKES